MIKDALSYLFDRGEHSKRLKFHDIKGDRAGRQLVENPDGSFEFIDCEPHPRSLSTDNLDHLIAVAREHFDKRVTDGGHMAVVYGYDSAELIFDTEKSDERMQWTTGSTREIDWFNMAFDNEDGINLSVEDAVTTFDTTLRETMPNTDFLKKIGKLKIVSEEASEAQRDESSSLVGGLAKIRVSEDTPLPEGEQIFNVRPFTDGLLTTRLPIKVYLRADLGTRRWVFMPVESSILAFANAASELVGERLRAGLDGTGIPVIRSGFKQNPLGK